MIGRVVESSMVWVWLAYRIPVLVLVFAVQQYSNGERRLTREADYFVRSMSTVLVSVFVRTKQTRAKCCWACPLDMQLRFLLFQSFIDDLPRVIFLAIERRVRFVFALYHTQHDTDMNQAVVGCYICIRRPKREQPQ